MPAKVTDAEKMFTFLAQLPDITVEESEDDGAQVRRILLPPRSFLKTLSGTARYRGLVQRKEPKTAQPQYILRWCTNAGEREGKIDWAQPLTLWWPGELPAEEQETSS